MPMLEWAGKKKVVNHHNAVPYHVLERKWGYGDESHAELRRGGESGLGVASAQAPIDLRASASPREGNGGAEMSHAELRRGGEAGLGVASASILSSLRASASPREENGGAETENMIIHGDNLLALKSLLPRYEGRVKCVYIDPPYNTGNEGWVYNDNVNDPQIRAWLNKVVGKEGEDFTRHDKWLCMMYPRLMLLRKLLAEDGAIFISIDDNEFANLRLVCDEIFGSQNFVATFTWKSRAKPSNTGKAKYKPQNDSEFILCYKGRGEPEFLCVTSGKPRSYPHEDKDGRYRLQTILKSNRGENKRETMTFSLAGYTPPPTKRWQAGEDKIKELYAKNRITFETGEPMLKYYEHEEKEEVAPFWCHIPKEVSGTAEGGKMMLNQLLGNMHGFDTVKPVELIEYLLRHTLPKNALVLDSFAGSGTTAHAVLNMNRADGGNRRFILIEMMDYAESVTAERVKRVISGYGHAGAGKSSHAELRRGGETDSISGVVSASIPSSLRASASPREEAVRSEASPREKTVEGTGGGFGYYELGPELMRDGVLNEAAGEAAIREYVWYTETKGAGEFSHAELRRGGEGGRRTLRASVAPCDPYLLGTAFGVAYYFCYERGAVVTLNRALLRTIRTKAERYVIYADVCTLGAAELEKYRITFKKIPRDITRF